jgi:flagellar motility protein MotE (MotC chaperone)
MNEDKSIQKNEEKVSKVEAAQYDASAELKQALSAEQIALQADLEKYTKEIGAVQQKMDALDAQKQELFRLGVRLEGVITYIQTRLGEVSKT